MPDAFHLRREDARLPRVDLPPELEAIAEAAYRATNPHISTAFDWAKQSKMRPELEAIRRAVFYSNAGVTAEHVAADITLANELEAGYWAAWREWKAAYDAEQLTGAKPFNLTKAKNTEALLATLGDIKL